MTLTNKKSLFLLIFSFIFVSSCETLEDLAGLNKVDIDDTLYEGTPDLILPPDFNKDPTTLKRTKISTNQQIPQENYQQMLPYQTVNPRITNFFSPQLRVVHRGPDIAADDGAVRVVVGHGHGAAVHLARAGDAAHGAGARGAVGRLQRGILQEGEAAVEDQTTERGVH